MSIHRLSRLPSRPRRRATDRSAAMPDAITLGTLIIPGIPEQVSTVRRWLRRTIGDHPAVDNAQLLASEIVANAITHTRSGRPPSGDGPGGSVRITVLGLATGGIRLRVTDDGGAGVSRAREDADEQPDLEDMRGLFLVERIGTRWGFDQSPGGTTTWVDL